MCVCVCVTGATTNSDSGVTDILNPQLVPTLKAIHQHGLLLLVHGEVRGALVFACIKRLGYAAGVV